MKNSACPHFLKETCDLEKKLKIAAIGIGPVGTIFAAHLAKAGAEIIVTDLPHRIHQVRENGLLVQWGEKRMQYRVKCADSIRSLTDEHPDCIFIATKACILPKILPDVAEAAKDDTHVLSVQNGIGTEDLIAQYVPPQNVCRMAVNYAGGNDDQGVTHVSWFNPPNYLGPLQGDADPRLIDLVEMLNSVGLTSELVDSLVIKKKVFLKTILNAALMPPCAILGITMKEAMEGKASRKLAEDLLKESLAVGSSLGYDYGENIFNQCIAYLEKGGDHHPSMSVDLKNKLPTEIDFINGKILELGLKFGVKELHVTRVMVGLIMHREVMNGTRNHDDFPKHMSSVV